MVKKRKKTQARRQNKRTTAAVEKVIKLKVRFNWSSAQMKAVAEAMYNKDEAEMILRLVRAEFSGGYCGHRLHGCTGCEEHFWLYREKDDCPICGNMEGR